MTYDKEEDEDSEEYLDRKMSPVLKALYRIKDVRKVCDELFGEKDIQWYNDEMDLCSKVLIGLMKLELEDHISLHEDIEEKLRKIEKNEAEWYFVGYEGDTIVLMNNLHQHAKISSIIFKAIKLKQKIDCSIVEEGEFFRYKYKGKTLGKILKSLQLQIIKNNVKRLPMELEELKEIRG